MAVKDYLKPEVGVAVAVTAALTSPRVRGLLRRGAVYTTAGVLIASDALAAATRSTAHAAQQAAASARAASQEAAEQVKAEQAEADIKSGKEAEEVVSAELNTGG